MKIMVNGQLVTLTKEEEKAEKELAKSTSDLAPILTLAPYQFWAMLALAEKEEEARDAVAAVVDAKERAIAMAKLDHLAVFSRDDPFVKVLLPAIGLVDKELDKAWAEAATL